MKSPAISLWESIVNSSRFNDFPYKVETTKSGCLLMSPVSNWHGNAQAQICINMTKGRKGGEVINECSILTQEGVKVADVAWASDEFIERNGFKTPYPEAPEICVEVVSPGNTKDEIDQKVNLYLAKGAIEAWVVEIDGGVKFFNKIGQLKKSNMVKNVKVKRRD